jgi:hypothetical protein
MGSMETYTRHIKVKADIPKEKAEQWNEMLDRETAVPDAGELIDHILIDLGSHGGTLEVDIKLCNGSDDSGPYLDCILFEEGCEIDLLAPGEGPVEGEYTFVSSLLRDGIDRSLTVEIELVSV